MAEEYQLGSSGGNWWQTPTPQPPQPRPETGSGHHPHPHHLSNYGWQTDIMDIKTRSSMEQQTDGASASGNSSMVFSNTDDDDIDPAAADQKLHDQESSASGLLAADPTLQMMGLGLSSHNMDWTPASLFHQRKAEGSFRTMLQEEETATANYQQQNDEHWREKLFGGGNNIININDNNNNNEDYKQIGGTCSQDLNTNFQVVDSSGAVYNNTNQNHALLQGLLVSENQHSGFYGYPTNSYGGGGAMHNTPSSNSLNTVASWSKYPHHQFLRGVAAPPPPKQEVSLHGGQLQFSNNAPFWNANSSATTVNDSRSTFFPAMQSPLPASNFQEKAKNNTEVRDSAGTSKKNCNDASSKRAREDTTPPAMPAFKVRKEKMGERITALQQLVSPFGKTDTASVLSEAIEYIKFLHEQVNVLSTPYMKSGAHLHQNFEKPKDPEGPKQDLRTRGLCLVPVSSTFPVTHETTVDYWNPTFGGTFRIARTQGFRDQQTYRDTLFDQTVK